jgi:peptidoglycan/LPS O-acetylase OafA/YrhL
MGFMGKISFGHIYIIIPFISGVSFVFLIELFKKLKQLNHTLLVRIGELSYSMYIIHFIFAHNISKFLSPKLDGIINGNLLLALLYIMTTICTFLLAAISEKFIEKPFINFGKKLTMKL